MAATQWTLDELIGMVAELLDRTFYEGPPNGRVQDVPDARTVRWYTTLGLVDRPNTRGRMALYGDRQLLQLVAIKRRQSQGYRIADIQAELLNAPDEVLLRIADLPRGVAFRVPLTPAEQLLEIMPPPGEPPPPQTPRRFWEVPWPDSEQEEDSAPWRPEPDGASIVAPSQAASVVAPEAAVIAPKRAAVATPDADTVTTGRGPTGSDADTVTVGGGAGPLDADTVTIGGAAALPDADTVTGAGREGPPNADSVTGGGSTRPPDTDSVTGRGGEGPLEADSVTGRGGDGLLTGLPLGGGAVLLLPAAPARADLPVIRAAARDLMEVLAARGLLRVNDSVSAKDRDTVNDARDAAGAREGTPKTSEGTPKTSQGTPKTTDGAQRTSQAAQKTSDGAQRTSDGARISSATRQSEAAAGRNKAAGQDEPAAGKDEQAAGEDGPPITATAVAKRQGRRSEAVRKGSRTRHQDPDIDDDSKPAGRTQKRGNAV
ncbi:MerR family transcriptional regulator [Dactylosporangium sp. CA-092794]|uniref:MerR family transcriptional regulator n=1 Tax=Dactylosporangium sp. CA-092794 TaxID=3239929 RepID=UPI003D8DA572